MATTTVVNVPQANRNAGTYTFAWNQSIPASYRYATATAVLNTADKLAVGNKLDVSTAFSPDGNPPFVFANSMTWTSYGPGGYSDTLPDGTVLTNPDPYITVPLASRTGQFIQATIILDQALFAGATITITI
jgi:hypothetical protein